MREIKTTYNILPQIPHFQSLNHSLWPTCKTTNLPKKYIINKDATILFWEDGTKTIVKRAKEDNYDKVKGFLWAYFQKTSGLSKTKANEYLKHLLDADDLKLLEFIKNGELLNTLGNVADSIGEAFKNLANNLKR